MTDANILERTTLKNAENKNRNHNVQVAQALATQMISVTQETQTTKRTAARTAIMNVIRAGIVKPGELLPSEKELTLILRVSLGTIQAALRGLQDVGIIVRKRGDGTRVATVEPFDDRIWHFRFMSREDGMPLRIVDQKIWIDTISDNGIWSEYLGDCAQYVRIRRILTLHDGVRSGAEMFLDATAASGLENIDARELAHASIRPYLEETFGLSTKGSSHLIQTIDLNNEAAKVFDLSSPDPFYEIHVKAFSNNQRPIYYQRIYVATSDCALMF